MWAAGESGSLKAVREATKARPGGTKQNTHVSAYWVEGKAMGTARDNTGT